MNRILSIRKDWGLIETLIKENRSILDIGCGDGMLMELLLKEKEAINGTQGTYRKRNTVNRLPPFFCL